MGRSRSPWRVAAVAIGFGVAFTVLGMAAKRAAPPPPNIVFILIDTLRADRVGPRDGRPSLTPFLDGYATRSVVFERAYAPAAWTVPSVASLFLGQLPFEHGAIDIGLRLPRHASTLAEVLQRRGVETAAFLASGIMVLGDFERGFTTFRIVGEPDLASNPDATDVNAAALDWLDHRDASRPFFLYLHYMEPHMPYRFHPGVTPPRAAGLETADEVLSLRTAGPLRETEPDRRALVWGFSPLELERLNQLYDGEVAYLDAELARLFAAFEARGALARTIVVVTADHGEEFGEHGLYSHGVALWEEEIRVPLMVRLPGDAGAGRVTIPVGTAGIGAALLTAAGVAVPPSFHVPPLSLDASAAPASSTVFSELGRINDYAVWEHRVALVDGDRKLLVTPANDIAAYDLLADPRERNPGPPTALERARVIAAELIPPDARTDQADLPADVTERLRALGYVDGKGPPP